MFQGQGSGFAVGGFVFLGFRWVRVSWFLVVLVGSCFLVFGGIWKCKQMHGNACKCLEIHGNAWKCTCMEMYGNAWKCMEMFGNAQTCMVHAARI